MFTPVVTRFVTQPRPLIVWLLRAWSWLVAVRVTLLGPNPVAKLTQNIECCATPRWLCPNGGQDHAAQDHDYRDADESLDKIRPCQYESANGGNTGESAAGGGNPAGSTVRRTSSHGSSKVDNRSSLAATLWLLPARALAYVGTQCATGTPG